jgi:prevent-host-death family protein
MAKWQLQEAKARFSEMVKSARDHGPQEITVHGRLAAVVLSKADYDRLAGGKPGLVAFLRSSPLRGARIEVERNPSRTRKVRV